MEYVKETDGNTATISMTGKFMFADHGTFNEILNLIKNDAIKTLTLDVNGIEFIDSAALGMFLIAREEAEKRQIKIILKNPQGQLAQMFKVSKFDTLFTIQ